MNTATLPYNQLNNLIKKVFSYTVNPKGLPASNGWNAATRQKAEVEGKPTRLPVVSPKSARSYLSGAITEGIKQNFMGSDINAEFLLLSIGVYSGSLLKYIAAHQPKLNFKQRLYTAQNQINNN